MGVAIFYSKIICAITVLILASLILIVPAVILSRKNRKKARNVVCGVMGTMVLGAGILIAWLVTHSSYPQINNLKFLGKNIDDISLEYEFDYTENNDDGTGYAMINTEDIVGHYVEIEYCMYRMDYNENGKITHVECCVPIGG